MTVQAVPKEGYWLDHTGAAHKVEIVAETTDGRYVVLHDGKLMLVSKDTILLRRE